MGDHVIGWPLAMFKCYINHLSKECQRRQKKSALCKHLRTSRVSYRVTSSSVFMIDKKRLQRRLWSRQHYKQFYLNNNIIALFLFVCLFFRDFLGIFYRDTHVFLVIFPTRDSNPARGNAVHENDFIKMWRIWGMQYHPHASNTRLRFVIRFLCV